MGNEVDGMVLEQIWNSKIYLQFTNLEERVVVFGRESVWVDVEEGGKRHKGKSQYNSRVYNIAEGDDHKPVLPSPPR